MNEGTDEETPRVLMIVQGFIDGRAALSGPDCSWAHFGDAHNFALADLWIPHVHITSSTPWFA